MTTKRFALLLTAAVLLLPFAFVAAQETEEEEPLTAEECPQFDGQPNEVRIGYYMGEGRAFTESGQLNNAIRSYTCILDVVDGAYTPAVIARANLYTLQRDYEEALEDFDALIADQPSAAAYNNRGIVHAAQSDYEAALADFNSALGQDENFIPGYNNRGVILAITGDYDAALADFNEVITRTNVDEALAQLNDPERDPEAEIAEYTRDEALAYALIGIVRSAQATDAFNDYLTLTGSQADSRVQSAAGALESRFTFELRLDDGTWLLTASLEPEA